MAQTPKTPSRSAWSGQKRGPWPRGAAVTHWPGFKLWAHKVNARGGLKLKAGQRKIELIEYDDRTQPGETIKAVERLATQDKADFIMAPYGTGFNLATAPIFAKYGYPQIAQAAVTDKVDELTKRYPTLFFVQGTTTQYATTAIDVLKKLKDSRQNRQSGRSGQRRRHVRHRARQCRRGPFSKKPASRSSTTSLIRSAPRTCRRS